MPNQNRPFDPAEFIRSLKRSAPPANPSDTVLAATPDVRNRQALYLWEEGNAPARTKYTRNDNNYFDEPDFRPYITFYPVAEGVAVKGAVVICAGGAFIFRSHEMEGEGVALELAKLGYQSFVLDYRLSPYTQEEGALDLARAVRCIRRYADLYGIDERSIAAMGFSAGGILAGEMLLNYANTVCPTALDPSYKPDELDEISADAAACGMIYSFYGRLAHASRDVEKFAKSNLPPTYFCYGTEDPFVKEFEANVKALGEAGVETDKLVLQNMPHGYGFHGGWIPKYAEFLARVFAND